ncbi:DUF2795 domain-containing protein [Actinomadura atramentaria]|uniref:DUF2795 domain-containing protein n=1 Tax=Actinomadura atramentaria TaxID=1990 RepID=UPI00037432AD|nr:DUF2795 domain-containing protein [Actinomadura atramentaria]
MRLHDAGQIKGVLDDMDFPAAKDDLVAHARERGADEPQLKALRALPLGDYDNLAEVLRSVPVDPAPDRSGTVRAEQERFHRHPDLAEHERMAEPGPIERELGDD